MWSIFVLCACLASASARTTQLLSTTISEGFSSKIAVDASGTVASNNVENITGTIIVEQAPFMVGVSRDSNDTVSAILGYANTITINQTDNSSVIANFEVISEISTKSVQGQLSVGSSSFIGNPSATLGATVTKEGLTNYSVGVGVGSEDGTIQATAQLTGVPEEGVTLQATTQIGPIIGVATRDTAGLWEETVDTELVVLNSPKITFLGGLHRDTNDTLEYVLGITTPVAWGHIRVDNGSVISYYLGGTGSGVQDDTKYTITGDFGYLVTTKAIQYNVSATVGPVTGVIAGELYDYTDLSLLVDLDVFVLSLTVAADGTPLYAFSLNMNNVNATLILDENFQPYSLTGNVWDSLISVTAYTDFNGDYNFAVQTQDQVVTFTL